MVRSRLKEFTLKSVIDVKGQFHILVTFFKVRISQKFMYTQHHLVYLNLSISFSLYSITVIVNDEGAYPFIFQYMFHIHQ